jgi:hypothetical protein
VAVHIPAVLVVLGLLTRVELVVLVHQLLPEVELPVVVAEELE